MRRHNELSCLTPILSTLHINFFSNRQFVKNKADDKCSLKFGTERVKQVSTTFPYWTSIHLWFIDSKVSCVAPGLLSVIRLMTETHLISMSLNSIGNAHTFIRCLIYMNLKYVFGWWNQLEVANDVQTISIHRRFSLREKMTSMQI